jgi:hypothetical protein
MAESRLDEHQHEVWAGMLLAALLVGLLLGGLLVLKLVASWPMVLVS